MKVVSFLVGLLIAVSASAQTARPLSNLRDAPSDKGKVIKKLSGKEQLKIKGRKGFWVRITADGNEGWLTLKDLAPKSGSRSMGIDTGRTGKGNIVSTSSARGLNAESLTAARPNFERLKELGGLSVSAGEAEKFAVAGGLKARTISLVAGTASKAMSGKKSSTGKKGKSQKNRSGDDDDDDDDEDDDD